MTLINLRTLQLPAALRPYAEGKDVPFPAGHFNKEDVGLAKWLRRGVMRNFQNAYPGLQYFQFVDYRELMRSEITAFVKRVLYEKCLSEWESLLEQAPRMRFLYEVKRQSRRLDKEKNASRINHLELELRREVMREYASDPRTLGELEEFVLGHVRYGIPTRRNYFHND